MLNLQLKPKKNERNRLHQFNFFLTIEQRISQ
jgi:hypothetical protein